MVWLQKNYSAVNVMPYGSVVGGYRALFAGAAGVSDLSVRALLVMCLALPAILPILGVIGAAIAWKRRTLDANRRRAIELLLLATVALVLTVFPRADVMHLAFVAALPYVLAGVAVALLLPLARRVHDRRLYDSPGIGVRGEFRQRMARDTAHGIARRQSSRGNRPGRRSGKNYSPPCIRAQACSFTRICRLLIS
jgi:hypothetical protein